MTREFLLLTQDEIDIKVAESLHSREHELMSYDFERRNHEAAIASLGDKPWPEDLAKYRGLTRDVLIVRSRADGLDSEAIQKLMALAALEKHRHELEAVKAETAASERHYSMLLSALPEGERRDKAIQAHRAKQDAR